MLNIPSYCPNYMLDLETNIEHVYLFTMKLHKKCVKRVLEYEEGRLPKFLLQEMIRANCGWRSDLENLGERWGVEFNTEWENRNFWEDKLKQVIGAIRDGIRKRALERATRSNFCNHYRELMGLSVDMGYMRDEVSFNDIRWIFKIRCGVLHLNDRPGRADDRKKCALCKEREVEDILHFMGRCPILREYRMKWFRKSRLDTGWICKGCIQ
uniref:Uncharacterized protein LOC114332893 n=1 Tax=Diabrotica virgifera virgifera TaxID=50390 RepID=A0A6P7FQ78_DIAVI